MTLIAGLTNSFYSILLADSRLTWAQQRDASQQSYGDVCQKIANLGNEGLVGFSGDVNTAWKVIRGITGTYNERGLSWLRVDEEVQGLLEFLKIQRSDPAAYFLVSFIDKEHEVLPGVPGAVLIEFSTDNRVPHKLTYLGLRMMGSGSVVQGSVEKELGLVGLLNFGSTDDPYVGAVQRSLFFAEVLATEAIRLGVHSVGGLFQVHFIMSSGVYAVPYERWVDLNGQVGTYVSMDIDTDGFWVQVHKPSGLSIRLGFPHHDEFTLDPSQVNRTFDVRERLTPDSPGVVARSNPQELYRPIDRDEWIVRVP